MKKTSYLHSMVFILALLCNAAVAADKANIVILATGGTIAGSADTQTQAGYTSGQVGVDILLGAVPQINDLRIRELAEELPESVNDFQRQGTRKRIQDGKVKEPTPRPY